MKPMAPATSRPRKSLEDYMALPAQTRAELIEGEIYMAPSPRRKHQDIVGRLYRRIAPLVEKQRLGEIYIAPLDVHLPSGDVVEPDLIFVAEANRAILQDWIRGTPDLLVEVTSPANAERDRIVKRDLYARSRVPEYWIVDPDAQTIDVLRLQGNAYAPAGYWESGTLETSSLPGLRLTLDEVFR